MPRGALAAVLVVVLLVLALAPSANAQQCPPPAMQSGSRVAGGWHVNPDTTKATELVQAAWDSALTSCAELSSSASSGTFDSSQLQICELRQQVVAGMNYQVTFVYGGSTYTMTLFQPLPHTNQPLQLTSCSADATS